MYYFFKIFGLATMNFGTKSTDSNKVHTLLFTRSQLGILYNVILISSITALNYFVIRYVVFENSLEMIDFEKLIDCFHTTIAGLSSIVILITFSIQQEKMVNIANKFNGLIMSTINLNSKIINIKENLSYNIKQVYFWNILTLIMMFATIQSKNPKMNIRYCNIFTCNLIITSTVIQYNVILKLIYQILRTINANFNDISKEVVHSRIDKTHLISNTDNPDRLVKGSKFGRLRELYLTLCEVSEDISNFYSQPMLMSTSYIVVTMIFFSNYIVKPLLLGRNASSLWELSHPFSRIIHYSLSLTMLTKSVTTIGVEGSLILI